MNWERQECNDDVDEYESFGPYAGCLFSNPLAVIAPLCEPSKIIDSTSQFLFRPFVYTADPYLHVALGHGYQISYSHLNTHSATSDPTLPVFLIHYTAARPPQ